MERRRANQQLEHILQYIPLGISRMDEKGVYTYWNPGNEKIFGYMEDEMVGKRTPEFLTKSPVQNSKVEFLCFLQSIF